ncbi:MAG: hypothetical protein GY702_28530 [Desulfobulbaceae bacterium]|nr:hypothetical protein [Desulfobulbaceae bacterium]
MDDLNTIAEIANRESLWFHADGAFGATAVLSKKYAHLFTGIEHGTDKLGGVITKNCGQARHLEARIEQSNLFELLTPVNLNIVCFRFVQEGISELDTLNEDIVIELQERGIAAPSTTRLNEKLAIRVNLTNHRTSHNDLDLLLAEAGKIGCELTGKQFT